VQNTGSESFDSGEAPAPPAPPAPLPQAKTCADAAGETATATGVGETAKT